MSNFKSVFLLSTLFFALSMSVMAQTQSTTSAQIVASTPDTQLLRTLIEKQQLTLEELRLTRLTLQRVYIGAYRAQMLTERLARQQARVDSLNEEVAQLKAQIQQSQDTSRDEDELKDLQATINETADPQQRAALIQSYNNLKRLQERQREYARQEAERNRERQQQLEASLHAEQSRLVELQDQLDALDREFEKQLGETRRSR